ncbi:MAG TPA: glycoside hydrolase family 2 TIM barrel-domain containing protein [Verrucomicrobiae bacterium]|nr:glycoside hydrolase family 2 TIM barrel-domain containing protein [Verrucomicrobiae bacterium]
MRKRLAILAALLLIAPTIAWAQDTQRQYLSGQGKDDAMPWRFLCTAGAQSGYWTNLPVPSNWELHGFGTLNYRHDSTNPPPEQGLYEHDFTVPANWAQRRVFLVFDGVMTDTSASLNGQSVGPIHQGGFYRFQYEVTKLVKFGASNRLEGIVAKHSANDSVNRAERNADYWVFGGIYRPVYLEAVPKQFIERVAIDARADGVFTMNVSANGADDADDIEAQITNLDGKPVGCAFPGKLVSQKATLKTKISSPLLWTAETPNLYEVEVRLKRGQRVIHRIQQRFGFRTFEVRDGDGLYLNGRRVVLKGVNRHSFWPDSGRCLSEAVHRLDIETIKDMNMNAVRMSHYPPDAEFLDLCDELGLYVLDELAGWHQHYDDTVGRKLVREMVARDVNHPCVLFWDNGNEGGFNTNLDRVFLEFDPQQRRVLHPWAAFNGLCTAHYLAYNKTQIACTGRAIYYHNGRELVATNDPAKYIYMPTEFLHGLYDGGAGAGLEDYWKLMCASPVLGGGFIWAFTDDGVKRPDTGQLDLAGNQAPDGIVGPYRQREASFYTIKKIWSPIQVARETNGTFTVENRYSFTDTKQCRFSWQLRQFHKPGDAASGFFVVAEGKAVAPSILPGEKGALHLDLPPTFAGADALALRVDDPQGRKLWTYVWPLRECEVLPRNVGIAARADSFGQQQNGLIELKCKDVVVRIDGQTGLLKQVNRSHEKFSMSNGPRLAAADGTLAKLVWQLREDGWLQCNYAYTASGTQDYAGVLFDYPEQFVKRKRWLGDGPYRVWKNRLDGVTLGVWENAYNNTITGYRDWIYPEFKGCFANVRWLQLETTEGLITVVVDGTPFVQVLTPEQPPDVLVGKTKVNLPRCGLGLLDALPPIGSKFKTADTTGPQGQSNVLRGDHSGCVSFYFGKLPPGMRSCVKPSSALNSGWAEAPER